MPPPARHRRSGPLAAALCGALAGAALSSGACTLIVDAKLNSFDAGTDGGDAGPVGGDSGPCEDQGFDDGSLADGGAKIFLSTGVAGPFAFHGRAFFPPGDDTWLYAPTVAAFASDAGVFALGAQEPGGARPGFRLNDQLTGVGALAITAGHIGASGSPCGEVLATTLDTLHDSAGVALWSAGCPDVDETGDAGVFSPRAAAADTGIGWSPLDGGRLGLQVAGEGRLCWDTGRISDCGSGTLGELVGRGPRAIEGLEAAAGGLIWATSVPGLGVSLQPGSFGAGGQVTVPAGAVVPLARDVALGLEAAGSIVNARAFNSAGALLGSAAQFYTGDGSNIVSSTLAATSYGSTSLVRVAWVGTDGLGRVLDLDASDPANLHAVSGKSAPRVVCGGQVRFVAPVSSRWVVVAAGEGLAVRPAP